MRSTLRLSRLQPTPVAAWLSSLLALGAVPALAGTTHTVVSCDDSASAITTPGTLRYWVKNAVSGDAISLTDVPNTCSPSTITLQQGELVVAQTNLTIFGPTDATVTISANHDSRIFKHTGTGILTVNSLTVQDGKYLNESAAGGCIYSAGRVDLAGTTVTGCLAQQSPGTDHTAMARGGGIFAKTSVNLNGDCRVSGNRADASGDPNSAGAFGGGIYVGAQFFAHYSTIDGNEAVGDATLHNSNGGGVYVGTRITLRESTISNNKGQLTGGIVQQGAGFSNEITNSTISGNYSNVGVGGLDLVAESSISNSTIVFNQGGLFGGLRMQASSLALQLDSTIIAQNQGGLKGDLVFLATTLSGANNLVMTTNVASPPAGLITVTSDPRLAPLANHGGPTSTHALLPGSPALEAGNDTANLLYDQRGPGFSRKDTLITTWTDIGAYQVQLFDDDEIFANSFGPLPGG
jgi:hypothetical protein